MRPSSHPRGRFTGLIVVLTTVCALGCGDDSTDGGDVSDISMGTPFVSSADIASTPEAFSTSAAAPWGFAHDGIDFSPSGDLKPFQSVASGIVEDVRLWQNNISSNWQVNVRVRYNGRFAVEYIFEPFTASQPDGQDQLANIAVGEGQGVSRGDPIGNLLVVGGGAHLHFGLLRDGSAVCPEPYFTDAAADSVLALIHKDHPSWNMCYP